MAISQISNGESWLSARDKVNSVIDVVNITWLTEITTLDTANDFVLGYDNSWTLVGKIKISTLPGWISDIVDDTSPQLWGNLDMNGNNIEWVTPTEMGYLSWVTSAIQTQLDAKAPIADPTFTGEIGIGAVNVSETELGILEWATLTTTELNYVDGVTSAIQTQLDAKITWSSPTITTPTLTLKQGTAPTPTAEGDIQRDTDDNKIKIGDWAGTKTFSDDSYNASTYAAVSHNHAASEITSGTLAHERWWLEADVSSGDGFVEIKSGSTTVIKTNHAGTTAPTTTDDTNSWYSVSSRWIDTTNDKEYVCLDATASSAVWTETTWSGGLSNIVDDTSPQLWWELDAQWNNIVDLADVTFRTGASGGTLRTGTSAADKFTLQAYDTNAPWYVTVLEVDAGTTVRWQLIADYRDFEDATDQTKIMNLDLSGITTGTTRTITMADQAIDLTPDTGTYQWSDAWLTSIAGLTTAADKMIYTTASDTYAVADLTSAWRALLDDADASAQRTTLGLAIGTDVQAYDAGLADVAWLAVTDGNFIVGNWTNRVAESGATARTSLWVGTGDSPQFTAIELWHASDTTLARSGAGTMTIEGNEVVTKATTHYQELWIDAGAMVATTTNGAASATEEYATNDIMSDHFLFDWATEEYVQFRLSLPDNRDAGTVKVKVYRDAATGASASDWVTRGISAGALANDDAIDTALGTEVTVDDTVTAVWDLHISPASWAITIAGSPTVDEMIIFQVARVVGDANDTMTEDAKLLGVKLQYAIDLTTTAR